MLPSLNNPANICTSQSLITRLGNVPECSLLSPNQTANFPTPLLLSSHSLNVGASVKMAGPAVQSSSLAKLTLLKMVMKSVVRHSIYPIDVILSGTNRSVKQCFSVSLATSVYFLNVDMSFTTSALNHHVFL